MTEHTDNENKGTGYVYVLWNEAFQPYGSDVYKLGRTNDIGKRMKGYTTSYLRPCELRHISCECSNAALAEALILKTLASSRISPRREFFKLNLVKAIDVIDSVVKAINDGALTEEDAALAEREATLERYKEYCANLDSYVAGSCVLSEDEQTLLHHSIRAHLAIVLLMLKPDSVSSLKHLYQDKTLSKYKLLTQYIAFYDISLLDMTMRGDYNAPVQVLDDELFNEIRCLFGIQRDKPNTVYQVYKLYGKLLRHLTCNNLVIGRRRRVRDRNTGKFEYVINRSLCNAHRNIFAKMHPAYEAHLRQPYA